VSPPVFLECFILTHEEGSETISTVYAPGAIGRSWMIIQLMPNRSRS
jgi:hypothetical protein